MIVSVVGNGKLSRDYGYQIDKSVLVIRFNRARVKGYERKVGTRTHILALAGATKLSCNNEFSNLDKSLLKEVGQIWFSSNKMNETYEKIISEITPSDRKIKYITHEYYIGLVKHIQNTYFDNNTIPSTGINILSYLVFNQNILFNQYKIHVYGFDQFKTGHYFDNDNRNNNEFHDLEMESKIIEYLKKFEDIEFFN